MTTQFADEIEIDGVGYSLHSEPLNALFRPKRQGGGGATRPRFSFNSTACWRGYIASWKMADGKLWLTGLSAEVRGRWRVTYRNVPLPTPSPQQWRIYKTTSAAGHETEVGTSSCTQPIFAEWFSGNLAIPTSTITASTERYMVIGIRDGRSTGVRFIEYGVRDVEDFAHMSVRDNLRLAEWRRQLDRPWHVRLADFGLHWLRRGLHGFQSGTQQPNTPCDWIDRSPILPSGVYTKHF